MKPTREERIRRPHTETYMEIFTGAREGGNTTIAGIHLNGFTLIANEDLAALRQVAAALDPDPIPQNIVDVLRLCIAALVGPGGGKPKTQKGMDALEAIRDLLKANPDRSDA